ncbi:hypothetical protein GR328_13575 [Microvirga makkahensis]|uniref:UmuC domain-containing protein n=1 Tax=Microvirga makkahensis TaxID=1128670 RepID=A0A7X3SPH6_9HYPH|nr:hypothetical protein [Microvirga makkahensis]
MTFALIEGNSFYCSWERVFDPYLKGRPVIVLSHNDGCAVARAAEAKALSIRMGEPFFRIRELCKRERVAVFYHTLGHDTDQPQRSVSTTVHLIEAINDTIILVMAAEAGARQI